MNNYLLSIDPSIKNTGFTLWKKFKHFCDKKEEECLEIYYWKPILVESYNFEKYYREYLEQNYLGKILNIIKC